MDKQIKRILTGSKIKAFAISFIAVFLMTVLFNAGIRTPQIISPLPVEKNLFLDQIRPKLQQKLNQFKLKKESSLIQTASADEDFNLLAGYAVVDFDTGEVLAESNLGKKLPIASITKIMTAVVALDLMPKDKLLTVSKKASKIEPTKMGVVPGQRWSVGELVTALLLTSANDATQVLAEGINKQYGEEVFVRAMNEKAKILNLKNTSFENPQGFDGRAHYSSPEDLTILSYYALNFYPEIAEIVKKDYQYFPANLYHKQADLYNWNGLLGTYPGTYGLKIGNTDDAGYTTTVVAEREGKKVFVVLLGAPGVLQRDLWASRLLDLGFQKLGGLDPVEISEEQLREKYSTWRYF